MAIDEAGAIALAESVLVTVAEVIGGPAGLALGALAKVAMPIYAAVQSGGEEAAIVAAIKASLVSASDAEMKATLGP